MGAAEPTSNDPFLDDDVVDLVAGVFRLLGDPTRIRILWGLLDDELPVNEIARTVDKPGPSVSQHLAKLRMARVVRTRRAGNQIFYQLENDHIQQLIADGVKNAEHAGSAIPAHHRPGSSFGAGEPAALPQDQVELVAEVFRMLADPTRVRIVWALLDDERPVNEIATTVAKPGASVSQHLAKLRMAGLVRTRRMGNQIFYRLPNDHVRQLVIDGIRNAEHAVGDGIPAHHRTASVGAAADLA